MRLESYNLQHQNPKFNMSFLAFHVGVLCRVISVIVYTMYIKNELKRNTWIRISPLFLLIGKFIVVSALFYRNVVLMPVPT